MNEQNIPTAPEQSAPAAPETAAPRAPAEEAVTVGALRGAIERKAEHIRARGLRPAENGLGGGGAGIVVRPDVSRMSRADRAALAARAERGERVKLSL